MIPQSPDMSHIQVYPRIKKKQHTNTSGSVQCAGWGLFQLWSEWELAVLWSQPWLNYNECHLAADVGERSLS